LNSYFVAFLSQLHNKAIILKITGHSFLTLGKSNNMKYIGGYEMTNQSFSNDNSNVTSNGILPIVYTNLDSDSDMKLTEDRYEVFVNGNFVGHKSLKNPGEQLSDIDGFLQSQGLNDFSSSLDGDHYQIQTNERDGDITDALSVYFNNR